MRIYKGIPERTGRGGFKVYRDNRLLSPKASQRLYNHSPNGFNFYVQDPNARKKSSPVVGKIRCNTIGDAVKALKSYFNKSRIELGRDER